MPDIVDRLRNHGPRQSIVLEAADFIEELLATSPRWIPVSERLPDTCRLVLVAEADDGNGQDIWIASYTVEGWKILLSREDRRVPVTHWMPLPEPPTDVAEQT